MAPPGLACAEPPTVEVHLEGEGEIARALRGGIDIALEDYGLDRVSANAGISDVEVRGRIVPPEDGVSEVRVHLRDGTPVRTFRFRAEPEDLILPVILPYELVESIAHHGQPEPPLTSEERSTLARLYEDPEGMPVSFVPRRPPPRPIGDGVAAMPPSIDLGDDFGRVCRVGPPTVVGDCTRCLDPRPPCHLGPAFGYFRPRSWVVLTLTASALTGALSLYSVSAVVEDRAIATPTRTGGHAMVGLSVGLGTLLAVLVTSDRRRVRRALQRELAGR